MRGSDFCFQKTDALSLEIDRLSLALKRLLKKCDVLLQNLDVLQMKAIHLDAEFDLVLSGFIDLWRRFGKESSEELEGSFFHGKSTF